MWAYLFIYLHMYVLIYFVYLLTCLFVWLCTTQQFEFDPRQEQGACLRLHQSVQTGNVETPDVFSGYRGL